ncbi:MAG: type IX secretion system sortase PorU [Calditrichaeota bacterium]|nr:MAG: type IX secretion system sortase PorU [Calditrichota bacterium]
MQPKIAFLIFFFLSAFSHLLGTTNHITLISSDARHMTIQWTVDEWITRKIDTAAGSLQLYTFTNAEAFGEIGAPRLPYQSVVLGIPEGAEVSAQLVDADEELIDNVVPAPNPRMIQTEIGSRLEYEMNDELYQNPELLPQSPIRIDAPYRFRNQQVVKIAIFPLLYRPAQHQVKKYNRLVIRIDLTGGDVKRAQLPARSSDEETLYKNLLINYEQAKEWRLAEQAPRLFKSDRQFIQGENWYKIVISGNGAGGKEGIYKITGATLKKAMGSNDQLSSIDPLSLQLYNNGGRELSLNVLVAKNDTLIENSIVVVGGEDGRFDDQDYILFYGRSLEGIAFDDSQNRFRHYINPYSYDNVFWLTYNQQRGKRVPVIESQDTAGLSPEPAFRDMVWIEEEKFNPFRSGITWLGRELTRNNNTYSVSFQLPDAVPSAKAFFRFSLASLTSGTHYFTMYANGNRIGQHNQNGYSWSFPLNEVALSAEGVLVEGNNTITLNFNAGSDAAFSYVNYIELEYQRAFQASQGQLFFNAPLRSEVTAYYLNGFSRNDVRIFDVTDFSDMREVQPRQIQNGSVSFADYTNPVVSKRYLAVAGDGVRDVDASWITRDPITGLRNKKITPDYIIITYDDFYQQALQLESLRENWSQKDRLETEIVNYSDVIKEFGWGIPDPAAIRNFLAWAQDHWISPRYVLLIGDGHYDYKDLLHQRIPNFIVPYETEGTSENYTRTTDDWYTYTRGENAGMQMAIGRLTVQTVDEAKAIIDKIVAYETEPEYGEWLKTVTIVADDEYTSDGDSEIIHTDQAERLAEGYVPDLLNVKKIYMINYPAVKTASITGREKPAATLDLLEQINRGSLIVNYIGHGNDELWAHERILLRTRDFEKIENGNRMALWIAATCEFAYWDQPQQQSFAEDILNVPRRGAVAMVSSARLAFSDENASFNYLLYKNIFSDYTTSGMTARIGDAILLSKQNQSNRKNNEKYALFGDPAMRLCAPRYRAVIDDISPDSIQALSRMQINGHIEDQGQALLDYSGKLLVRVLDTRKEYRYYSVSGVNSSILRTLGNTIFRGIVKVEAGRFQVQFIVPKDISYGGIDGRISLYFWNDNSSGAGAEKGLIVGGTAVDLIDNNGPKMSLHFGDPQFVAGDYVSTRPTLHLIISDSSSGVNTAGDIGHQILLTLDENFSASRDMTDYFTYNEGSYTQGVLRYPIIDIPLGEHTLQVKAWDNSNNSSIIESRFVVIDDSQLEIRNLLTFPNPMTDECTFRYELSQDAQVSIKIYTVSGRMIRKFDETPSRVGYNIFPQSWDGLDQDGDPVANGVYLYKVTAKSYQQEDAMTVEKVEKLILTR